MTYFKRGVEIELLNGAKRKVIDVIEFKEGKPHAILVEHPEHKEAVVFVTQIKQ